MSFLFTQILYRPLFNLLLLLYNYIPGNDLGIAIIALTVLVRAAFFPLSIKAQRSQKALSAINPKIQEIRARLKNDSTAQNAAILQLYKEHKVNPFGGCLPILIQLPILIALYRVFVAGINPQSLSLLYSFIHNPETLNKLFLGFLDLTSKNHILAIVTGLLQFMQSRQSAKYMQTSGASKEMAAMNSQMLYLFPVIIIVIGWNLPAGLLLYWVTATGFSMLEQLYLKKQS
ncbi:YidC/Oxa1 family membrane protein insertase [Candidatus Parcubacteria bacterium]|nr:YidC/Oxa1 family membrane protein insertase [Candidatus Parcubacteria bacterium]